MMNLTHLDIADPNPIDRGMFDWPTFGLADDIRPALAEAINSGRPGVLATLYAAAGGTPRSVGAQMLITRDVYSGFLSGGCIEADVAAHAMHTLEHGEPQRLIYGEGGPFDIQLPCGSRIEVLLERIAPTDPAARRLIDQSASRKPALWVSDGQARVCLDPHADAPHPLLPKSLKYPLDAANSSGHREAPFVTWRSYQPQIRLVVVGSEPTALALLRLGTEMGFETILVRPHGPDFPPEGVSKYIRMEIPEALNALELDPWTSMAVLTHDLKQEHAALVAGLASPCFYVGALGSHRRIPSRNARLQAAGVGPQKIELLRAPIGLPIGGKSPWGIAVSIAAEILFHAGLA